MKTYLSVVVLSICASVASGGAILTVGNPMDNEAAGNLVEVDVTVSGLPATLGTYLLDVDFTPGVLSALSTDPGTVDNAGGTISGIAASNVGLNLGGTLFRLYFNAIGPGTSFLSASSVVLLDSGGNSISCRTVTGMVDVAGTAPIVTPEPSSLWLLLIGMALIGARRLKQRRPRIPQTC